MAQFTESIREILFKNKGDDDPMTLDGLHDIAERVLFGEELNVLSDDYVDRFITGFVLHYFNDEIGYETLPMWKFALKEKIYNNAEYINAVYAYLDKQIFSDYKVRKMNTQGTKSDNISVVVDGTVATQDDTSSVTSKTGTASDAHTGSIDREGASVGSITRGGSDTVENSETQNRSTANDQTSDRTGSTVSDRAGTDTSSLRGSDETDNISASTNTKTGTVGTQRDYDSTTDSAGVTDTKGGDVITETTGNVRTESGSYTDAMEGSSSDSVDDNAINIQFDTPMGSLSNLRTPDTTLRGEGVSAAAQTPETGTHTGGGRTYNYMSAASESDASRISGGTEESSTTRSFDDYAISDSGSRTVDGTASHVQTNNSSATGVTGNDDTTTTYDTVDAGSGSSKSTLTRNTDNNRVFSDTNKRTDDLHDHTSGSGSEALTRGGTGTTTYGSNEQRDASNSDREIFGDTVTHTDDLSEANAVAKTGQIKTDNATQTQGDTATTENAEEVTTNFNYEMFMKAEPMMSKLWTLFDPLFIMIIDAF